ncbi:putative methionine--tRNA ligase [Dictyocaulus viviparus]|uniref:Methionine--tRNA ligase, mitochondrial n=1 Tax=Dictyocaulus viviparus TaxID=29172 RepID=A0A0D8XNS4_DICVI|nr:putative methionine--tRNA ligase [Dictyocaulus viviparus]
MNIIFHQAPHLGHLYTVVLADAAHRWFKLRNPNSTHVFTTGTDEHGIKVCRHSLSELFREFCDETSKSFCKLFEKFLISNTDFVRTTEKGHWKCVEYVWEQLYGKGLIYKDTYAGWYSIVDECFFPTSEVEDSDLGKVVKGTNTVVEWVEEQNYMFRLSSYRMAVREWLEHSDVVYPKCYLPSVMNSLEYEGDLSISRCREKLSWGIPVPGDDSQIIYVWLDALVNYLSIVGYPDTLRVWPPTCQIFGKDILKFHVFYWPALLMAMGLSLPQRLFIHGHWLVDNTKMSKSLRNVIDPCEALELYTTEGLRYFLLKQGVPSGDSNFSHEKALSVINSDLVNNIGNLLSRATVRKLNPLQMYPRFFENDAHPSIMKCCMPHLELLREVGEEALQLYDEMLFYKAIEKIMAALKSGNGFFQMTEPWKLEESRKLDTVLYVTYETLRILSILLQPIVPSLADHSLTS